MALWQTVGPKQIDKNIRKRYFEMLGVAEPPEEGDYLVWPEDVPKYKEAAKLPENNKEMPFSEKVWMDQYNQATRTAWSKEDYPIWAAVVERNEKPLKILADGLQRTRFYSPWVSSNDQADGSMLIGCVGSPMTTITAMRNVAQFLAVQAMFQLHDGDVSGKWRNVMTLYRLERLYSQSPFVSDRLTISCLGDHARQTAVVLSQYEDITAEQARECQRQLRDLPAMRPIWELYNEAERCSQIEGLLIYADGDDADNSKIFDSFDSIQSNYSHTVDPKHENRVKAFKRLIAEKDLDWTELLRRYNVWHDRLVQACKCRTCKSAAALLTTLKADTIYDANRSADWVLAEKPEAFSHGDPKIKAQRLAELAEWPVVNLIPKALIRIEQKRQAYERMTLLAFALAGYRAEHEKHYPKTLAELAPNYIDAIPHDPFSDDPLLYKSDGDGYLLYSVGMNGRDDGGFGQDNMPDSATEDQKKESDDISIRTPGWKTK